MLQVVTDKGTFDAVRLVATFKFVTTKRDSVTRFSTLFLDQKTPTGPHGIPKGKNSFAKKILAKIRKKTCVCAVVDYADMVCPVVVDFADTC